MNPDERYTHRLEAFSDIVLGFSLGQLAINSAIPPHAIEILTRPTALVAYVITFGIVASIWALHHRLFTEYFVPNRISVALNFVTLGFVVFLSYAVQAYVRFSHAALPSDASFAAALYCVTLGIVFALLGVLYLLGVQAFRAERDAAATRRGYARAVRLLCMGSFVIVGIPLLYLAGVQIEILAGVLFAGGGAVGRAIGRALSPPPPERHERHPA